MHNLRRTPFGGHLATADDRLGFGGRRALPFSPVDVNSLISTLMLGLVVVLVVVRGRAKRSDRKRDAREAEARERQGRGSGRSLY